MSLAPYPQLSMHLVLHEALCASACLCLRIAGGGWWVGVLICFPASEFEYLCPQLSPSGYGHGWGGAG